jgi:glutamate/tyrosine decarboxylase-like PLP-dependent enzyme
LPTSPPPVSPAPVAPRPDRNVAPASTGALHRALEHATAWLDGLDARPVAATVDLPTLRARFAGPYGGALPHAGTDAAQVVDDLAAAVDGGLLGSAGGRFFAWVIGGSLPSALAADWLAAAWDQNAAMYASGPAAAVVEEVAGAWCKEVLDLPREASFAFTTGCQLAHVTCLAAARHAVLARAGWDVGADGLCGAPSVRVLTSEHRHGSIDRAVRFLGLGARSLEALPTDADGRVTPAALAGALARRPGPIIVVLDAADLNVAAFDPFAALIPLAHAAGAWVHVDGAFGLFARASRAKRHLLDGVEAADSWATDAHKWLNVPFDCGLAVVRDAAAHRAAMTVNASYLAPADQARDQIDWNPEWSRRARGFAVYAALRELGRDGLEALVDRTCAHCHALVTGMGEIPGAEVVWAPQLNQGLVRFLDPRPGATDADHDRRADAVIAAVNATGEAFFSGTTWRGRRAMRVSVVSWRTGDDDVRRALGAVRATVTALGTRAVRGNEP